MKCTNKEQEQEFISEILRILKREIENPTYDDLSVEINNDYTRLSLYEYVNSSSRKYIIDIDIRKDNNATNILQINTFGRIGIELDENQLMEFLYTINLLKNKFIEKSLFDLKSK